MSKKYGFGPYVFLLDIGGDDVVSGGGSGQAGVDPIVPVPCAYSYWQTYFQSDVNNDGTINEEDFRTWWTNNGFTEEAWNAFNSDLGPLNPEPVPTPGGEGGEAGGDAVSEAITEMMGDIPG